MKTTYLLLVLLLAGCASNTGSGVLEHKILDINTSQITEGSFDDHFVLKEMIVLDTCREAVFDNSFVNYVYQIKDKLVLNDNSPRIMVFDRKTGKIHKKIDRVGRGPEEYSQRASISIQDGEYIVMKGFDGDLMYYDVDGNFIKKNPATNDLLYRTSQSHIELLNNGNILVYCGLVGLAIHKSDMGPYYSARLLAPDGKLLKGMVERSINTPRLTFSSTSSIFYKNKEEFFLTPFSENTIYQYHPADSLLKPIYTFNINGLDFKAEMEKTPPTGDGAMAFSKKVHFIILESVTDRYLIVNAISMAEKGKAITMLINRKNGEITNYLSKDICGSFVRNGFGQHVRFFNYGDLTDKEGNLLDLPIVAEIQKRTTIDENMNGVLCIYEEK